MAKPELTRCFEVLLLHPVDRIYWDELSPEEGLSTQQTRLVVDVYDECATEPSPLAFGFC